MDSDTNSIFDRKKNRLGIEKAMIFGFRISTYFIVFVFALIIGRIVVRGAPVLAGEGISFLTEHPKTLIGFYDEYQKYHRLTSLEYQDYEKANPEAVTLAKQSANFVGGGIGSPLVGTIILILICITFSMTVGISAAVFLNEYSKQGFFCQLTRLAVTSLVGIPSIVFGLFGLAFFCYFFPVISRNTPVDLSKAWEIPSCWYPSQIADEGYRIDVADHPPERAHQKIVVSKGEGALVFSVFNSRGDFVKRVKQAEIGATKPTWVDIERDLATIIALRDADGAEDFYQNKRTVEEENLISKLRPLLKLRKQLWLSFEGWKPSLIAAGFTLACMVLPIVITTCEDTLRAVPQGFRDASFALGATHWQAISKSVLPYALPGMLISSVLGILRVAGETAPIMFTGAFASGALPWVGLKEEGVWKIGEFFQRECEAMPYHIYILSAKTPQSELVRPMLDGAVLVFMLVIMAVATASVMLRMKIRKRMEW